MESKIRKYEAESIDVTWDQKRCIHAAKCVDNLKKVFNTDQRPWIQPQNAEADVVAETVTLCPSGALHYERKDGGAPEHTPEQNTITLDQDGPLYVHGDVKITEGDEDMVLYDTRVALCRCGMSDNKPLCDNSHIDAGFKAASTIAEEKRKMPEGFVSGGELVVAPSNNGPLHITGNFEILDGNGDVIYRGDDAWMCRCGGSQNKPFCDGTHNKIGFVSA